MGYVKQKSPLLKNNRGIIELIAGGIKGVHTFTKGICPKVNVTSRQGFELTYIKYVVQHFNHWATGTKFFSFCLINNVHL